MTNNLIRPDFPLVWDNSMRSNFVACPRKFEFESLRHYKPPSTSIHLTAGKAWASAMEEARLAYYGERMLDPEEAVAAALQTLIASYGETEAAQFYGTNKSLERMMEALAYYFRHYPLDRDDVRPYPGPDGPMVEFSFALPLDETLLHPVTGEPILYTGRADMVATYAGAVAIFDDKTTGQLGDAWARQWERRAQFTGYVWAARKMGIPVTQCVIRGIAILKTMIKDAQAVTNRLDHHVAEWHKQVIRDIRRAIACWQEGYYDRNLSDACSSYGGCIFQGPCGAKDPLPWLEGNFQRVKWDPVTRTETLLESEDRDPAF